MPLKKISVDPDWTSILQGHLPYTIDLSEQEIQCQLLFSLLLHLNLSLRDFIFFIFESKLPAVRMRVGSPMSARGNRRSSFLPSALFKLWIDNFPGSQPALDELIVQPRAKEIVYGKMTLLRHNNIINA